MLLILCHIDDHTAFRVLARYEQNYPGCPVKIVTIDEIALSKSWKHEIGDNRTNTVIELNDGSEILDEGFSVVLNRLKSISLPYLNRFSTKDQEYATMELYALVLSWLKSIPCPLFNQASPRGLGSVDHTLPAWLGLISSSGLPAQGFHWCTDYRKYGRKDYIMYEAWSAGLHQNGPVTNPISREMLGCGPTFAFERLSSSPTRSTLIAGTHITGWMSNEFKEEMACLQRLSGCEILQLFWGLTEKGWRIISVQTVPVLTSEPEIDAIVGLLHDNQLELKENK